ncbi:helix-turn-helix domain-containing protein [Pseudomonas chengduensis]|nr:helix-turn-helix domain-containing protein [Pseudomonas chengduensis]MDH1866515.1 helix-turn-helix domain-containing protein [Pseudomonas chengduensis]
MNEAWNIVANHPDPLIREQEWAQALNRVFLSKVSQPEQGVLHGEVSYNRSPQGIEFVRLAGSPQVIIGDYPAQPNQSDSLWLALTLEGEATLTIDDRNADLSFGDILYGSTGVNHSALQLNSDFRVLTLEIPHAIFYKRLLNPLSIRAGTISGQRGIGRLLSDFLFSVSEELEQLTPTSFHPVEMSLAELLIHSLSEQTDINTFRDPGHAKHFREMCHFIELHIGDPDLNLQRLAELSNASVRYVQKVFKEADLGFNQYVRRRRLELCKRDMSSRLNSALSISEICYRRGFNDLAYFSRAFSAEFGLSPRAYRTRKLDE